MAKTRGMVKDDKFWAKVRKSDGCWLWTGATNGAKGYGKLNRRAFAKFPLLAHRYAWFLATGTFPKKGLRVLHKCDVPNCVRPPHLFIGTDQDNMLDKENKGRGNRGERHGLAKLTARAVKEIRLDLTRGVSINDLAAKFLVTRSNIEHILHGRRWRHV